jgi:iron complex outermembrane receptor protein
MRVTASRRSTTGYESLYDDSHRSQLQFRGDFRISPADDVSVKLGMATESFGEGFPKKACNTIGGFAGTCDENPQRTDFWRNGFARFDWSHAISETSMLKVAGGIDQEFYRSNFLAQQFPTALPIVISAPFDGDGHALRQNLEIQRTDVWARDLRTMVGAEVLREEVRSPGQFSTDASISASELRIFGGVEWKPALDWVINTGGMWEKHSIAGSNFAPRLAVNYHLQPDQTLRAVSTKSFRMPSIYMFRGLANLEVTSTPLLRPVFPARVPVVAASGNVRSESVISNEIGYLGEFRRFGLKLDVRAFSERIDDRHWTVSRDFTSLPGPDIHGVEYQFDWRPFAATRLVFAEAVLREEPGRSVIDEHFEAPHRTGSIALYQNLPGGFDLSLITYYATPSTWAGNLQVLDSTRRLDARLAYAFRVGATRGELAVTAQSLGGSHLEFSRTQTFGRHVFTSLRLDF